MSDYCPGAVQVPQPGGVTLDRSLPPRFVWHITWDALKPDGSQPQFSAVADYLKNVGYCPHIMWNPFTGYMEQYYTASVGGRALAYNNQDGTACIQVEVFFTPGCAVDGIKYNTVAETPLKGLDVLLEWGDSLGVPRIWPLGSPQWQGNSRDVGVWNSTAGHYGHCHSPGDTHTDPGPMPSLNGAISAQSATITTQAVQEDDMFSDSDRAALARIDAKVDPLPTGNYWTDMINAMARVDQRTWEAPGKQYWADLINAMARVDASAATGADPAALAQAIAEALPATDANALLDALAARLGGK